MTRSGSSLSLLTGLPLTGLSTQYAIDTAEMAMGAYAYVLLLLRWVGPGRVVKAMSPRPLGRSAIASGSVSAALNVSAIGFDPVHRPARHWFIARNSIGEPIAAKLALLSVQLSGAGAKLSGTTIRFFQEHDPVSLLKANCPKSVPSASRLWLWHRIGRSSVSPPCEGTITSEHRCLTPQPRNWFSASVRI